MDKIATVKNKVKYAEWITMVEDCRNSGLPVRVWCKENFVGYKTYYYRLRKLRSMFIEEHKEDLIPEIAPLPVVPQQAITSSNITIHIDGLSIDIPDGASENTIISLLRVVKTAW